MKVAIVGAGSIAEIHVQALQGLGHEVVVAIGTDISKTKKFTNKYGIRNASIDFNDALKHDIDVVHICTPPTLHYQMVKDVLNKGKHVICEKPLTISPKEAKDLMNMATKKSLINAVNFNVRFHEACGRIKNIVNLQDFGNINFIHGSYLQEFHVLPTNYSWRYKEDLAGPMRATSEIGSHWIDLSRYLTNLEIVEVSANFGKFNSIRYLKDNIMYESKVDDSQEIFIDTDDCAVVSLRFSNGAIGSMLLSEVSHGRNNKLSIEISSSKQSIWWNTEDPYNVNSASISTGINTDTNAFGGGFIDTFKNFFIEVYQDITSGGNHIQSYPTFRDGYINSMVCNAILESANNNARWTKVDYNI